MNAETIFQVANLTALAGWLVLLASPWVPLAADRIAGLAIPLLLAVVYATLLLVYWQPSEGGFDTLANLMKMFQGPEVVLAGWLHYLAFDMMVGAWEVRTARAERIPFLAVVPCLALTFLLGPVGFLVFNLVRSGRRMTAQGA